VRNGYSRVAIIGALVSLSAFALAAVLFVADTSAATQRLAMLFALLGTIVAGLISALRSDAAANSTNATSSIAQALNGGFDGRVRHAIRQVRDETGSTAMAARAAADAATAAALSSEPPTAPNPPVRETPWIGPAGGA
jgi:hypothetical protein